MRNFNRDALFNNFNVTEIGLNVVDYEGEFGLTVDLNKFLGIDYNTLKINDRRLITSRIAKAVFEKVGGVGIDEYNDVEFEDGKYIYIFLK